MVIFQNVWETLIQNQVLIVYFCIVYYTKYTDVFIFTPMVIWLADVSYNFKKLSKLDLIL